MNDLDRLKQRVSDFVAKTGISKSDLGRHACRDASFVSDLMDGREPKFSTIRKVNAWMDLYETDPDAAMGRRNDGGAMRLSA